MRLPTIAQMAVAVLVLTAVGAGSSAQSADEAGVVHFTVAGDFGASANTNGVLAGMHAQQPDLTVTVGDLSYQAAGTEQSWCDRVTSQMGAGFPFELLAGNHESNGQNGNINDFAACLPNQLPGVVGTYGRQWYVDVPQVDPLVRFVMISPNLPFPDGTWSYAAGTPRYNWTAGAIDGARSTGVPWVVVGMHKPCLSLGEYNCDIGTDLMQLLMSKRVDLVLTGHEHLYQRTHQLKVGTGCTSVPPGTYDADCVADRDTAMNQGAGTVFATVGTGGQALRAINTADSEYPYFAAASAASHGFLDVRATADDLEARFLPTDGSFTDAFTIHAGPPPPNTAPTAQFSATSDGLVATFDGRASGDAEGPITYAWNFGDGTSGTGAQPQHTYPRADTFDAVLTVTDSQGLTGTVTHPVTVTAATTGQPFASDAFARTVSGGLGTADVGGAWTTTGGSTNFSVSPGAAALRTAAGVTLGARLDAARSTDTDLRLVLSPDRVPTSSLYLPVTGRRVSTNNEYQARVVLTSSGRVNVSLGALRGSSTVSTVAPAVQLPVTYAAGTQLAVRFQVTGTSPTTLRLKVWVASGPEPAAWQLTATDSGAGLQTAGGLALTSYLSSGVTNGPVTVRLSQLSARPVA